VRCVQLRKIPTPPQMAPWVFQLKEFMTLPQSMHISYDNTKWAKNWTVLHVKIFQPLKIWWNGFHQNVQKNSVNETCTCNCYWTMHVKCSLYTGSNYYTSNHCSGNSISVIISIMLNSCIIIDSHLAYPVFHTEARIIQTAQQCQYLFL